MNFVGKTFQSATSSTGVSTMRASVFALALLSSVLLAGVARPTAAALETPEAAVDFVRGRPLEDFVPRRTTAADAQTQSDRAR